MGSDNGREERPPPMKLWRNSSESNYLHKFKLYVTHSNFYMIGWDKNRTIWKVLKVSRLEPFELNIMEDPANYSEAECHDILQRIHDGNKSTGGLKFVTIFYGIVGFARFWGPYYMLLITKRRKVGSVCGHAVYSITKSEMIPIPNSTVQSHMAYSKKENRYKKLLHGVDLTKDFYFSHSYHIMLSLQKNLGNHENALDLYETMFVWNEYLTRRIRNQLRNTTWTVALIFGFFKQVEFSVSERRILLTLIARRSRHYAGTRYLKRGVNEEGCVANDVETEQIVYEEGLEACSTPLSSIVQYRGSIPLFWSQETSRLNIKPDIILYRKDHNYEAARLHFENLVERYGNPIIIMNLVKTNEKKPRESILRAEFANAIEFINKDLCEKNHLKFLHWDLNKFCSKSTSVLERIVDVAANAMDLTGFFYCERTPTLGNEDFVDWSYFDNRSWDYTKQVYDTKSTAEELVAEVNHKRSGAGPNYYQKPLMLQNGVLRTNCIDCLDRTNVAQYAYGLVALGRQLNALGVIDASNIDIDSPLADKIMKIYEEMGDMLALQYGGSPAHKKIFSERRGQWRAATKSQEFFRTLQRYYSNAYMDGEKQDSINVFLGHFQPQVGKPALWELHPDEHYSVGTHVSDFSVENPRFMTRSLSDGNILCERTSTVEDVSVEQNQDFDQQSGEKCLSGSTPEISTCESDINYSRYMPAIPCRKLLPVWEPDLESDVMYLDARRDSLDYSNFLDLDWLSSSGNSVEEETYERSTLISTSSHDLALYANAYQSKDEKSYSADDASGSGYKGEQHSAADVDLGTEPNSQKFSKEFINWIDGDLLFP